MSDTGLRERLEPTLKDWQDNGFSLNQAFDLIETMLAAQLQAAADAIRSQMTSGAVGELNQWINEGLKLAVAAIEELTPTSIAQAQAERDAAVVSRTLQSILNVLEKHCSAAIHEQTRTFWNRLRELMPILSDWKPEEVAGIVDRMATENTSLRETLNERIAQAYERGRNDTRRDLRADKENR